MLTALIEDDGEPEPITEENDVASDNPPPPRVAETQPASPRVEEATSSANDSDHTNTIADTTNDFNTALTLAYDEMSQCDKEKRTVQFTTTLPTYKTYHEVAQIKPRTRSYMKPVSEAPLERYPNPPKHNK
jgi:hypothetical protein